MAEAQNNVCASLASRVPKCHLGETKAAFVYACGDDKKIPSTIYYAGTSAAHN